MNQTCQPPASQAALVAALMRQLASNGQPVQCFVTYIYWVLVAGGHAYKLTSSPSFREGRMSRKGIRREPSPELTHVRYGCVSGGNGFPGRGLTC